MAYDTHLVNVASGSQELSKIVTLSQVFAKYVGVKQEANR